MFSLHQLPHYGSPSTDLLKPSVRRVSVHTDETGNFSDLEIGDLGISDLEIDALDGDRSDIERSDNSTPDDENFGSNTFYIDYPKPSHSEDEEPEGDNSDNAAVLSDRIYLSVMSAGFVGGILLVLFDFPALVPSLFFGTAVASLVHRYMGGIRQSDASISTRIGKLGGTLASLVITTMLFNTVLEKQMVNIDISISPDTQDIVALSTDSGDAVTITINGQYGLGSGVIKELKVNQYALDHVKQLCRDGQGFCKEEVQAIEFAVEPDLKPGFAVTCAGRDDLDGYPFLLVKDQKQAEAMRAVVYAELTNCLPISSNTPLRFGISREDAQRYGIAPGDRGLAMLTNLKNPRPKNGIYTSTVSPPVATAQIAL